jgi:hypothetical protein
MSKLNAELPIPRPRCPRCQLRMIAGTASPGPEGFEHYPFECLKCGHREFQMILSDPMKSDALGWLSGELGHPPPKMKSKTAG